MSEREVLASDLDELVRYLGSARDLLRKSTPTKRIFAMLRMAYPALERILGEPRKEGVRRWDVVGCDEPDERILLMLAAGQNTGIPYLTQATEWLLWPESDVPSLVKKAIGAIVKRWSSRLYQRGFCTYDGTYRVLDEYWPSDAALEKLRGAIIASTAQEFSPDEIRILQRLRDAGEEGVAFEAEPEDIQQIWNELLDRETGFFLVYNAPDKREGRHLLCTFGAVFLERIGV